MVTLAYVDDLMDRSRVSAAFADVTFVRTASPTDAQLVIVDLARYADQAAGIRAAHPAARIVAFGPHVARNAFAAASAEGFDAVVPRSTFFSDPQAVAQTSGQG